MRQQPRLKVALAILAVIFLLGQFWFVPKVYVNSRIVSALQAPTLFLKGILNSRKITSQLSILSLENQSLRAQIEGLKLRPEIIKDKGVFYIRAQVYSNYPANNANKIILNVGFDGEAEVGQSVVVEPGIFLGEVEEVEKRFSVVRTIFDPGWELPVKIGPNRVDALFVGGAQPRLTLISKNKNIVPGYKVYLVGSEYSYGLVLGSVNKVLVNEQELFDEATMATSYNRMDLDNVFIRIYE